MMRLSMMYFCLCFVGSVWSMEENMLVRTQEGPEIPALPVEMWKGIVEWVGTEKSTVQEATQTLSNLARTSRTLYALVNDATFTTNIIKKLHKQYGIPKAVVAYGIETKASRTWLNACVDKMTARMQEAAQQDNVVVIRNCWKVYCTPESEEPISLGHIWRFAKHMHKWKESNLARTPSLVGPMNITMATATTVFYLATHARSYLQQALPYLFEQNINAKRLSLCTLIGNMCIIHCALHYDWLHYVGYTQQTRPNIPLTVNKEHLEKAFESMQDHLLSQVPHLLSIGVPASNEMRAAVSCLESIQRTSA